MPRRIKKTATKRKMRRSVPKMVKEPVWEKRNERMLKAVFRKLSHQAHAAFRKLKNDFHGRRKPEVLIEDLNMLGLILGEANAEMRFLGRALSNLRKNERENKKAA